MAQFVSSNYISVELTDIIAALASLAAVVLLLKVWQPEGGQEAQGTLAGLASAELDGHERPRTSGTPGTTPEPVPSGGVPWWPRPPLPSRRPTRRRNQGSGPLA